MKMKADVARRKKKGSDWNDQRREYSSLDTYWRRVVDKRDQCVEIETNKLFDDDRKSMDQEASKSIMGIIDDDKSDILNNCVVCFCQNTLQIMDLVKEFHQANIKEFLVMRVVGSTVLLMFTSGNRDVGCIDIRDSTIPGGDRLDASN
ncbi:hypothetical protein V6N13_037549 [Hibiscus sabdariffa]